MTTTTVTSRDLALLRAIAAGTPTRTRTPHLRDRPGRRAVPALRPARRDHRAVQLRSTSGPVPDLRISCPARHHFTLLAESAEPDGPGG